jgi:hypothetical protein
MVASDASRRQALLAKSPRRAPAQLYTIPPRPADLTERQERVLLAIEDFRITHRRGPTAKELCAILGFTCRAVDGVLCKLIRKGRVERHVLSGRPWHPSGYSVLPEPAALAKGGRRR